LRKLSNEQAIIGGCCWLGILDRIVGVHTWDRFYATGDALGALMDRVGIAWRPAVAQGQTPYDILAGALSLSDSERAALLAQAQELYEYPSLLTQAQGWAQE
jgi:hypothetical protein